VTRRPALYPARCPVEVQTLHLAQSFCETLPRSREPDAHGVGGDTEDLAGFGLTETVPDQQAKEFLILGSHPGQGLEGRRLDSVDHRDILGLGAESKAEPEASAGPSVLVGKDAARGGQQPGQGHVGLGQAIDPPPRDGKGLGDGVLSVASLDVRRRANARTVP
jgi:hypothetical protein